MVDLVGEINCRVLRSNWNLHPHPSHPHCCEQLRNLLQQPAVAERGGAEEERENIADQRRTKARNKTTTVLLNTMNTLDMMNRKQKTDWSLELLRN